MKLFPKTIIVTTVFLALAAVMAEAQNPRVVVDIGEVTVSPESSLIVVPVYLTNPLDSVAGVEIRFTIDKNSPVYFASDEIRMDGLVMAADTVGTLMSGWEWVGVSSIDDDFFDLKVAGLADWPDNDVMLPIAPQSGGVLVRLVFRNDNLVPLLEDLLVGIKIDPENTGVSDPAGNTIGIVTSLERRCGKYAGDSCLEWHTVRVGARDTTITRFEGGLIRVIDSVYAEPEEESDG